jgi:hypothetical protein
LTLTFDFDLKRAGTRLTRHRDASTTVEERRFQRAQSPQITERVERTLLSAAFDVDFDFDLKRAGTRLTRHRDASTTVEERRFQRRVKRTNGSGLQPEESLPARSAQREPAPTAERTSISRNVTHDHSERHAASRFDSTGMPAFRQAPNPPCKAKAS